MSQISIDSSVPAGIDEVTMNDSFKFSIQGKGFSLQPLALVGFIELSKKIRLATYETLVECEQIQTNWEKANYSRKVRAFTKLLIGILEPIPFWNWLTWLMQYNCKYWHTPSRWVFSASQWLANGLSFNDLQRLVNHFVRYSVEKKNDLFQILQHGIGSITQDPKPVSTGLLTSTEEDSTQGFQSLGSQILGLQEVYA